MKTTNFDVATATAEVANELQLIDANDKLTLKLLADKINQIITEMQSYNVPKGKDRGPKSEKDMTEEDARRIQLGDLKDVSHKDAATQLGLSYGQIYSARKGFTFKTVYKEVRMAQNQEQE